MYWLMPRFAHIVVNEGDLRQAHEHGLAVSQLELRLDAAADDLLRGDTINVFRPRAHEFYPAAGHNEGLEPVGTQVGRSSSIG